MPTMRTDAAISVQTKKLLRKCLTHEFHQSLTVLQGSAVVRHRVCEGQGGVGEGGR